MSRIRRSSTEPMSPGIRRPSTEPMSPALEQVGNRDRASAMFRLGRDTRVLDVHAVDLERVRKVRTCRAQESGKDDASDGSDLSTVATSSVSPSMANGAWANWYSISLTGFVVTEWFTVLTSHKETGGKTRNLVEEEIIKVELDIGEARLEAHAASDGSGYTAMWRCPEGMKLPVQACVLVTYKAHGSVLATRPLKITLGEYLAASQFCVLQ